MNLHRIYAFLVLSAAALFLFSPNAQAYTATDYYNAGLQLYNTQNYSQAIQYFSAAIQVDPNNTAALQGRANCYYTQGQYQQALDDYQKVQALSPNPQLASMIQALQAKVGASSSTAPPPIPGQAAPAQASAAPPPAPGATASDSFPQGVAFYQQQQYAQAIPYFQKATQENPGNSKAYYYLGVCQMQTGDMKDAAVALGISNKISPNPSVEAYVNQLKSRLSPDDQQWVDGQITAAATASAAGISAPASPKNFGIRFEPAIVLPGLGDFNAEAQSEMAGAKAQQSSDPSLTYSASVPAGYPNIAFEPVFRISPQFELGLPIAMGLVGTFTENSGDGSSSGGTTFTFTTSAFSVGINGRYLLSLGRDMDLFVAGGPLLVPVSINVTSTNTGANVNFSAIGFGGQLQLGVDYHLADSLVVGPFAGFQFANASGFTGTYQGQNDELYFYTTPPSGQSRLITDGPPGSPPQGARPLVVDLSGPFAGIQVGAFF